MVEITIDHTLLPPFQPIKAIDLQYGENYVLDVAANSQYAVASASDSLIRLYDLGSLELAHTLRLQKGGISKIKLYNDQYLFSSSADGSLCRWDLRMCAPAQVFKCIYLWQRGLSKCNNPSSMSRFSRAVYVRYQLQ